MVARALEDEHPLRVDAERAIRGRVIPGRARRHRKGDPDTDRRELRERRHGSLRTEGPES
jgi:hypothetical protein